MKKILLFSAALVLSLSFVFINQINAGPGFCFMCGSGSSCQYCQSPSGKDTSADRKICKERGCKITGTASCPTAANYKVCR